MNRITLTNGSWFNEDSAIKFSGLRHWDGNNMVCAHGNSQWGGCALYYTKSGNWVLNEWYNGQTDDYTMVSESMAVEWLIYNEDYEPQGLPKKITDKIQNLINLQEV